MGGLVVAAGSAVGEAAVNLAPKVKARLTAYLKQATKGKVTDLSQVIGQATSGNVPAIALLGRGVAQQGVSPDQVWNADMIDAMNRAAGAKLVEDMRADFNATYGTLDQASLVHASSNTAHELVLKKTFEWAKGAFGSNPRTLKEAHVQLKMFVQMDEAALDHCIALY